MRVLHVIQHLGGYGAERQLRDLLPYLQSRDMTVAVLTMYGSQLTSDEKSALPFSVIDIGRKSRTDYRFLPRMIREIRSFKPDIVHTHTHSGKYWGRIAAWLAGVRTVVFTEHNPCDPRRGRVERLVDPLLHARTTRIVTFFAEQRPVLARTDRVRLEKIVVIPNGLMPRHNVPQHTRARARALLSVAEHEHVVFVIGRLTYQKNQQLALRALALMPDVQRKAIRLFFAGSGADEPILRGLSRALDLEGNVRFLGYRSDLAALLPGADLLLMTSLFEGMPLTLIEAMNAGVPVLSTPWTGVSEMLGNGRYGFLSPGWTPEDTASEMQHALLSGSNRRALALRAREHAREAYDIRRMADAHLQLYLTLRAEAA